jgi:transposase
MDVATKHQLGISKDACSDLFRISHSKVERCYKHIHWKEVQERKNKPCPRVLGIDEHFLNRKVGYVTTLADLKTHRVFDLLPGRSELALEDHLKRLKGRENVRVVVMDLSSTYRALVQKYFPNATIVADRFHVVRLINLSLMHLWKTFDEQGRKNRGLISLMRRHRFKLSLEQRRNLERYFKEFPALGLCYHKLKDLKELMLHSGMSRKTAKFELIPKLLRILGDFENTPFEALTRLAKTITSWLEPIGRMWRFARTNSITEGLHNKMELIQRRAFGFHSFQKLQNSGNRFMRIKTVDLMKLLPPLSAEILAKGVDVATVQAVLGHQKITTTMGYVHLLGENLEKVTQHFHLSPKPLPDLPDVPAASRNIP